MAGVGTAVKVHNYLSPAWTVEGAEIIYEFLKSFESTQENRREGAGAEAMITIFSMFIGVYMAQRKFSVKETVADLRKNFAKAIEGEDFGDHWVYIQAVAKYLRTHDKGAPGVVSPVGEAEPEAKVDLDLTLDEDDDAPLVRPRKRVLPVQLREPTMKEKERAAESIGSSFVPTGGKRGFQLKHVLLPTGDGPWAQICRDQALIWTGRLQAGVEAGTITKAQYDGHKITPEEWNMGGSTPFLNLRLGPDRRSHYQTFSRKQRENFKSALRGEKKDVVSEPPSNSALLTAELRGGGAKKRRVQKRDEDDELLAEIIDEKHEVVHPDMELSDHDEETATRDELIRTGKAKRREVEAVEILESICPECGHEKDELAQVCPTCMRAGHFPTQDLDATQEIIDFPDEIEEIAPLPIVLPAPVVPLKPTELTFGTKMNRLLKTRGDAVKGDLESIPMGGDPHIVRLYILKLLRPPPHWPKYDDPLDKLFALTYARHVLVAVVKAGIFIFQSDQVFGVGMETVQDALGYDLMDILGLFFSNESIYPGWNLYPTPDQWYSMGINPSEWKEVISDSELGISENLKLFLTRRLSVWKGFEGRDHASDEDVKDLEFHIPLIARVQILMDVLIDGLLAQSLPRDGNGDYGDLFVVGILRDLVKKSRVFDALNRSRKKNPLTLVRQCDKVNATFIDNLRKFLANK